MEFNEDKAKEIVEKLGISEKTIQVWKSRGAIPNRYADENYTPTRKKTSADEIKLQRIRDILKSEVFNMQVVTELSGVAYPKLADALRGKGRISTDDIDKVVNEIKKLKSFVRNKANADDVKSLFKSRALKFYVINGKDDWAKSMYYALSKNNDIYRNDKLKLIENYRQAELKSVI